MTLMPSRYFSLDYVVFAATLLFSRCLYSSAATERRVAIIAFAAFDIDVIAPPRVDRMLPYATPCCYDIFTPCHALYYCLWPLRLRVEARIAARMPPPPPLHCLRARRV